MKAASQEEGPTQTELDIHNAKTRRLAALKAKETKRRRYKETSEWVHPLGKLFHGVAKESL